jgi:RsiW-degrading membrane proteinase PrsW (M82 family)
MAAVLLVFGVLGFAVDGVSKLWGAKSSPDPPEQVELVTKSEDGNGDESVRPGQGPFLFDTDSEFTAPPPPSDVGRRSALKELEDARKKMDWRSVIDWNLRIGAMDIWSPYFILALVAGLVWAIIAAQFAGFSRFQIGLYAAALVLGIFSATLTIIVLEIQTMRGFVEGETFSSRMIYMVAGIGLREEVAKLLCFAPLLIFLRKRSEIEALVVGGMVGLGFAINENIHYYMQGSVVDAFARLITANFLHLAMTALISRALFRMMLRPKRHWEEFLGTFLAVVVFHGLYDAFLSVPELEGFSLLALVCLAVMAYYFCDLLGKIGRVGRNLAFAPVAVLVIGLAVLIGCVYLYACWRQSPFIAAMVCVQPLFVLFPIVAMFVQRLRDY